MGSSPSCCSHGDLAARPQDRRGGGQGRRVRLLWILGFLRRFLGLVWVLYWPATILMQVFSRSAGLSSGLQISQDTTPRFPLGPLGVQLMILRSRQSTSATPARMPTLCCRRLACAFTMLVCSKTETILNFNTGPSIHVYIGTHMDACVCIDIYIYDMNINRLRPEGGPN